MRKLGLRSGSTPANRPAKSCRRTCSAVPTTAAPNRLHGTSQWMLSEPKHVTQLQTVQNTVRRRLQTRPKTKRLENNTFHKSDSIDMKSNHESTYLEFELLLKTTLRLSNFNQVAFPKRVDLSSCSLHVFQATDSNGFI